MWSSGLLLLGSLGTSLLGNTACQLFSYSRVRTYGTREGESGYQSAAVWPIVVTLALSPMQATAAMYVLAAPQFSVLVNRDYSVIDPVDTNGVISRSKLTDSGHLYFSFKVVGSDAAVAYLKKNGRLEVEANVWANGIKRDTIEIGITQQQWRDNSIALVDQFNNDGQFTWRTYLYITPYGDDVIEILIRDAFGKGVGPAGYSGSYRAIITVTP